MVAAKKKLTELREQVVRDLGHRFPRKSYIRALRLIEEGDPLIKVFGEMLNKRWKLNLSEIKGEHIQEFLPRLQELHKILELPSLFRLEEMAEVFYQLHSFTPILGAKHNGNYADFLMSTFMGRQVVIVGQRVNTMNEAASDLRYKIEKLKGIIELGEAVASDKAFIRYLLKLRSRLSFYH